MNKNTTLNAPEVEEIKVSMTKITYKKSIGPNGQTSKNLSLSIKNEYECIDEIKGSLIQQQGDNKNQSHGFLLEKASITVACGSTGGLEKQFPAQSKFGRDVSTNMAPPPKKIKYHQVTDSSEILLENMFRLNSYPTCKERHLIAKKCGLNPNQVRQWFTKRRKGNK